MTSSMWHPRMLIRLGALIGGTILAIILFGSAAYADNTTTPGVPPVTVSAPTSAQAQTGANVTTSVNGAAATQNQASTAAAVTANVNLGGSTAGAGAQTPAGSTAAGAAMNTSTTGSTTASVSVQAPVSASVTIGSTGSTANGNVAATTPATGSSASGSATGSTVSGNAAVNVPAAGTTPNQNAGVTATGGTPAQVNGQSTGQTTGNPGVIAQTAAAGTASPNANVQANAAGQSVSNTTTVPTQAGAANCTLAGLGTSGAACGSTGQAAAVAYAPTTVQAATTPSTNTQASVLGQNVNNTTTAPTHGAASTCPVVGIAVTGYGCGQPGQGAAALFAPTSGQASTTPAANTNAQVLGQTVNNSTTAPTGAAAQTCPLVGVAVSGYGCSSSTPGSGTAVVFAPTSGAAATTPSSNTQAQVLDQTVNNSTTVPTQAGAATCPLVGIDVHGYSCANPGSGLGVVTAPTTLEGTTDPTANTQANVLGQQLNNGTALPTGAGAQTCPLVGIAVVGYGCENQGSALGVITAPTTLGGATAPASHTQGTILGQQINNSTVVPTGAGLATCPVIGIAITGYGCENPGSALGLITAPTTLGGTTTPTSRTQATVLGQQLNNTTTLPTQAGLTTCPVIGIAIMGYGCENPGSALGLITAPTTFSGSTVPTTATQGTVLGQPISNTTTVPTTLTGQTCPVIGIAITGYGCGNPGSATGVVTIPTTVTGSTIPTSSTQTPLGGTTVSIPTQVGGTTCPVIGLNVTGYGCGQPGGGPGTGGTPGGSGNGGNPGGSGNGGNPGGTGNGGNPGGTGNGGNPGGTGNGGNPGGNGGTPGGNGGTPGSGNPPGTIIPPITVILPPINVGNPPVTSTTPGETTTVLTASAPVSGTSANATQPAGSTAGAAPAGPVLPSAPTLSGPPAPPAGVQAPVGSTNPGITSPGSTTPGGTGLAGTPIMTTNPNSPNGPTTVPGLGTGANVPAGSQQTAMTGQAAIPATMTGAAASQPSASLAALPRTGGGMGVELSDGSGPALPLFPLLMSFLLLGLGILTRRMAVSRR